MRTSGRGPSQPLLVRQCRKQASKWCSWGHVPPSSGSAFVSLCVICFFAPIPNGLVIHLLRGLDGASNRIVRQTARVWTPLPQQLLCFPSDTPVICLPTGAPKPTVSSYPHAFSSLASSQALMVHLGPLALLQSMPPYKTRPWARENAGQIPSERHYLELDIAWTSGHASPQPPDRRYRKPRDTSRQNPETRDVRTSRRRSSEPRDASRQNLETRLVRTSRRRSSEPRDARRQNLETQVVSTSRCVFSKTSKGVWNTNEYLLHAKCFQVQVELQFSPHLSLCKWHGQQL